MKKIINLAQEFIKIRSSATERKELGKILDLALSHLKGFTIEKFEKNGARSALVYRSYNRPKNFKVILNAHLDIIPGKDYQYIPKIRGNRLYGAGAMDMKANASVLIAVFKDIADKVDYPLALQLVTDEEIGGNDGTKHQIEKGVRADFVIAGEPTNFDIVNRAKGILRLKISSFGTTFHAAYPWRGENAILKMGKFLKELNRTFPTPKKEAWITTVNLSRIATSNEAINKIPDDCSVWLDIRFIPEDSKKILNNIKKLVPKGFTIEVLANEPALETDISNKYIKILEKIGKEIIKKKIALRGANGSSDARHFARVKGAGIEFGPIGGGIGSDNEWVDIKSLEKYYQILTKFLLSI